MSDIRARRNSLLKSSLSIKSIRNTVVNFTKGLVDSRETASEIVKKTNENNKKPMKIVELHELFLGACWIFLSTPEPFLGAMPGCAWLCLGVPARSSLYCLPQNVVSLCERYANTMRNLCENTPTQPEPAPPTPALVTPALPILRQATPLHPRPAPTMALLPQAPVMTMP